MRYSNVDATHSSLLWQKGTGYITHLLPDPLKGKFSVNAFSPIDDCATAYQYAFNNHEVQLNYVCHPQEISGRGQYLLTLMRSKRYCHEVLMAGNGPAREVYQLFDEMPGLEVNFTCLENDEKVIAYARKLHEANPDRISFIAQDMYQFNPSKKYDLVWVANYFDKVNDCMFIQMLHRYAGCLSAVGEIVAGCYASEASSGICYRHNVNNHYAFSRTPDQLLSLAAAAGFDMDKVFIGTNEHCCANFLHIRL